MELSISPHVSVRMEQRGVAEQEIVETLSNPDLTRPGNKPDRIIYERNIGKTCLCRNRRPNKSTSNR